MKNRTFILVAVTLIMVLLLVYLDKSRRRESTSEQFHPKIGSVLQSFLLKDTSGNEMEYPFPLTPELSAIFILPKPCLSCNPNFYFLDKLSKRYKDKFYSTWIISTAPDRLINALKKFNNPYEVYTPADHPSFNRLFKINSLTPQVTLLKGRTVIFSKSGELDTDDYFQIKKILIGGST